MKEAALKLLDQLEGPALNEVEPAWQEHGLAYFYSRGCVDKIMAILSNRWTEQGFVRKSRGVLRLLGV